MSLAKSASLVSAVLFAIFTLLLAFERIGEMTYCFLIVFTAVFGLVLYQIRRVQEVDFRSMKVVLRELEETKQELFVREEKLKSIALPLAQIVAYTGASEGRVGTEESFAVKRRWYKTKVQQLAAALEFDADETADAQKFLLKYEEIDALLKRRQDMDSKSPEYQEISERLRSAGNELQDMLKTDIAAAIQS